MRYLMTVLVVALVGVMAFGFAGTANAASGGGCNCGCGMSGDMASSNAPAPPAVAQAPNAQNNRRFSYEPSTQTAPTYRSRGSYNGGFDATAPLRAKGAVR